MATLCVCSCLSRSSPQEQSRLIQATLQPKEHPWYAGTASWHADSQAATAASCNAGGTVQHAIRGSAAIWYAMQCTPITETRTHGMHALVLLHFMLTPLFEAWAALAHKPGTRPADVITNECFLSIAAPPSPAVTAIFRPSCGCLASQQAVTLTHCSSNKPTPYVQAPPLTCSHPPQHLRHHHTITPVQCPSPHSQPLRSTRSRCWGGAGSRTGWARCRCSAGRS